MSKLTRSAEIDVVRFICNIMLVAVHAYPFMYVADKREYWFWTCFCNDFARSILPALFLLSGYLFFSGCASTKDCLKKFFKRIGRLGVPYVLWNSIFVVGYAVAGCLSARARRHVDGSIDTLAGALAHILPFSGVSPMDSPMWFVQMLLLCAAVSPLFWFAYQKAKMAGLILCALALAWLRFHTGLFCWAGSVPEYAFVCYAAGAGLAMSGRDIAVFFRRRWSAWMAVGVAAIAVCSAVRMSGYGESIMLYQVPFVFTAVFAWSFVPLAGRLAGNEFFRKHIMPTGFFVYASHIFFNSVFMHCIGTTVFVRVGFAMTGCMTVIAVMTQLCVLAVTIPAWHVLHRVCPRFLDMLEGNVVLRNRAIR